MRATESERCAGARRWRCAARCASSRYAGPTPTPRPAKVVDLFGDRARWGQTMQAMQLAFVAQVLPGFTGACDVRPGDAVQLRRRRRGPQVPRRRSRTARCRCSLLFSGTVFTGVPRVALGRARALAQGDAGADARRRSGARRWTRTSRARPGCGWAGRRTTDLGAYRGGTGWSAGTTSSRSCCGRRTVTGARGGPRGRRRGALRGLRPLPVPRQRAEEPGAVAVGRADAAGRRRAGRVRAARGARRPWSSTAGDRAVRAPCGSCRCSTASVEDAGTGVELSTGSTSVTPSTCPGTRRARWSTELEVPLDGPATSTSTVRRRQRGRGRRAAGGRLVRTREPLALRRGRRTSSGPSRRTPSPWSRVRVENRTGPPASPGDDRPHWLRRALVAATCCSRSSDGRSLSLLDPPRWAAPLRGGAVRTTGSSRCSAGPDDQARRGAGSPIILYDHAAARAARARRRSSTPSRSTSCSACAR